MRIQLQKTKTIKGNLYRLSLITEDFYFYSNYQEGDENGNTLMYRRSNDELVSDNYFAYGALEEVLEKNEYLWISQYLKKCYKNYKLSKNE
jgi:hypothetical protein